MNPYKGFLKATCSNNLTVRVKSAAGKTAYKLFVGAVHHCSDRVKIESLNTQKVPHTLPVMGCLFYFLKKIDGVITSPHYIYTHIIPMVSFSYLFHIYFLSTHGRSNTPRLGSGHSSRGTCDQDKDYGYMLQQQRIKEMAIFHIFCNNWYLAR